MGDLKTKDLVLYGGIAIAAYLVYKYVWPLLSTVGGGIATGVSSAEQGIANLWVSLTGSPPMNVLGTVQFPNGSQAPISSLPIKTDSSGNVYTNAGGITYQLQPWITDANTGQPIYPAVAVGT